MSLNVHFLDKTVSFLSEPPADGSVTIATAADEVVPRAKLLKILETCNRAAILSADPEAAFRLFAAQFRCVEAAGTLVTNPAGDTLMMFRRGRYDLPKGHIETGETPRVCAVRETAEETGLALAEVGGLLCTTRHAYNCYGGWELKSTHWFAASCDGTQTLVPQHEEGIERLEWVSRQRLAECLADTYPTIREVIEARFGRSAK